ncbi:hypothetical protein SLA2020_152200 [Shorea laevis]
MNAKPTSIGLVESINKSSDPVIPQLEDSAVQTRQGPWTLSVKAQSQILFFVSYLVDTFQLFPSVSETPSNLSIPQSRILIKYSKYKRKD